MFPFADDAPHCNRCGGELDGGEEGCPRCGFNPRQQGLRVSMALLLIVVVSMTVVMLTMPFSTTLAPYLVGLAAVSFVLAVVTLLVSFLATPSRLGFLFARF